MSFRSVFLFGTVLNILTFETLGGKESGRGGVTRRRQIQYFFKLIHNQTTLNSQLSTPTIPQKPNSLFSPHIFIYYSFFFNTPDTTRHLPKHIILQTTKTNIESMEDEAAEKSRFKRVCVFCGSSSGKRNCYRDAAVELGQELVSRRLDLVYGGGSVGLMGLVSQEVHRGGRHVLGVIPRTLMCKEITGETIGEVRPVANMHQRKAEMARQSDCFIALPGGYGTLEELLEVITWAQLGIHDKPIGLLNVDGYYNYLLTFIDKAVEDGFIKPSQRQIMVSAPTAKELVQKLEEYEPLHDEVVAKARWEAEQVELNASLQSEIAR